MPDSTAGYERIALRYVWMHPEEAHRVPVLPNPTNNRLLLQIKKALTPRASITMLLVLAGMSVAEYLGWYTAWLDGVEVDEDKFERCLKGLGA